MSNDKRDQRPAGLTPEDLEKEGRIDWERKQKGKRQERYDHDTPVEEFEDLLDQASRRSKRKKSGKHKRREFVYDESQERVVVKRKRKRRSSRQVNFDWDDQYDL